MTALDDCVDWAKSEQNANINLQQDCPNAYLFLLEQNLLDPSPESSPQTLTDSQLEFLQRSLMPSADKRWSPEFSHLQQMLDQMLIKTDRDREWEFWDEFIDWLKQLELEQYAEGLTDLADFIHAMTPSKETMKILLTALIVMVFITILYLVAVEFQLAGLIKWPRKNATKNLSSYASQTATPLPLSWQQLLDLPTQKQPAAMLKFVIHFLTVHDSLQYQSACTNLELLKKLKKSSPSLAVNFKQILRDVEPVIYGNRKTDDATLQRIRHTVGLITVAGNSVEG